MAKKIQKSDISEEDVFKGIRDSAKNTLETIKKLDKELKDVATTLKNDIKGAKFTNTADINKFTQAVNKANKAKKDAIKIDQQEQKANEQLVKSEIELQRIKREKLKTEREEIRTAQARAKAKDQEQKASQRNARTVENERNAYKRLVVETRNNKNESKRLAARLLELEAAGKKNTKGFRDLAKEYKRVTTAAQRGDAQLKKIDRTVGDNFRNVGNYRSALGGLRSTLLKVGGAFGIAFGAAQIRQFFTSSIEAFRVQQKAIAQVEAGLKSTGNQAGFTSEQLQKMASELQKSTLFGDEQILKDATAQLLTFTNITGQQFERTQAAALDLATRLDGDLKSASIQLGKALNDPIANLSALSRSGIQFSAEQKEVIKALAESGQLAEAQTIILDELNKQYGGSAKAAAEADGGITQLSNAFGDAKEKIGAMLIEALRPTIQSLKEFFENLSEEQIQNFVSRLGDFLKMLGRLTAAFAIYRIATSKAAKDLIAFSGNILKSVKNLKLQDLSLKNIGKGTKAAASGFKKMGSALKGIGFVLAIDLAFKLGSYLYDLASGAQEARIQQELLTAAQERAAKSAENINRNYNENIKTRLKQIELEKAEGKLTDEQFLKRRKQVFEETQKEVNLSQRLFVQRIKDLDVTKQQIEAEIEQVKQRRLNRTESIKAGTATNTLAQELAPLKQRLAETNAEISERTIELKALNQLNKEVTDSLLDNKISEAELGTEIKRTNIERRKEQKSLKETKQAYKDLTDEIKRQIDAEKELQDLKEDFGITDVEKQLDERIAAEKLAVEKTGNFNAEAINKLIDQEEKLKKARIERRFLDEVEEAKTAAEVELAYQKRVFALIDLEDEITDKRRDTFKEFEEAQEGYADSVTETNETIVENEQNTAEQRRAIIQALTDYAIKQSERRIEAIDKEIEAAEKQADNLRELAAQGNIEASESIAEQQRIIAEANRAREKELQRQQRIKLASTIYDTYQSKIEAGSAQPLAETIRDTTLLQAFISSLPAFEDGTEDTGKNGQGIDGKGGFHAILHPNERVMTKGQNAMIGDLTNVELARLAQEYNAGQMIHKDGAKQLGGAWESTAIVNKLNELQKAIESKPETNIELERIIDGTMKITRQTKQGNNVIFNRYKVRK